MTTSSQSPSSTTHPACPTAVKSILLDCGVPEDQIDADWVSILASLPVMDGCHMAIDPAVQRPLLMPWDHPPSPKATRTGQKRCGQ